MQRVDGGAAVQLWPASRRLRQSTDLLQLRAKQCSRTSVRLSPLALHYSLARSSKKSLQKSVEMRASSPSASRAKTFARAIDHRQSQPILMRVLGSGSCQFRGMHGGRPVRPFHIASRCNPKETNAGILTQPTPAKTELLMDVPARVPNSP